MEATILHVTSRAAWQAAQDAGEYRTADLPSTGFIHFCRASQLEFVLERYFKWQAELVILHVNVEQLDAELRWEESEPGMPSFPHLYGPLNLAAVERVS